MNVNEIAKRLIKEMSMDNGCNFKPTGDQMRLLENAVFVMKEMGCNFSDELIEDLTAGEYPYVLEKYKHIVGFADVHKILENIFNNSEIER